MVIRESPAASVCPFCPGNESHPPREIFAYRKEGSAPNGPGWSVRVIPEADPYFRIEQELVREGLGLYDRISPRGATELIVESPSHDDTAATLGDGQWEQVLWMYGERIRDLKRDQSIRDILVTRRHRAPGSRITHPYSRLTAIPIIFDEVRRKLRECREHYEYKRRCVYCDMIRQEIAAGDRVVRLTDHFLALSPYAACSPYETWILPRRCDDDFLATSVESLADALHLLFVALRDGLNRPAFNMWLHRLPGERFHWHFELQPRTGQLAGLELGGDMYINSLPAVAAARRLRAAVPPRGQA